MKANTCQVWFCVGKNLSCIYSISYSLAQYLKVPNEVWGMLSMSVPSVKTKGQDNKAGKLAHVWQCIMDGLSWSSWPQILPPDLWLGGPSRLFFHHDIMIHHDSQWQSLSTFDHMSKSLQRSSMLHSWSLTYIAPENWSVNQKECMLSSNNQHLRGKILNFGGVSKWKHPL